MAKRSSSPHKTTAFYSGTVEISLDRFTDEQILAEALRRKLVGKSASPVALAASAFLEKVSDMTTEDFSFGREHAERDALCATLNRPVIEQPWRWPQKMAA